VIDGIIEEPLGGAHRNPEKIFADTRAEIAKFLGEYGDDLGPLEIRELRREKFLAIGTTLA
jgi:acetyl-CoA carboxylase carboxyl transferase subunit alpha